MRHSSHAHINKAFNTKTLKKCYHASRLDYSLENNRIKTTLRAPEKTKTKKGRYAFTVQHTATLS